MFPEPCNMCTHCNFIQCLRQACVHDFAQIGNVPLLNSLLFKPYQATSPSVKQINYLGSKPEIIGRS